MILYRSSIADRDNYDAILYHNICVNLLSSELIDFGVSMGCPSDILFVVRRV